MLYKLNVANASVLTRIATEPLSARNQQDIASIIKAHLMPGQVQVDIEFDPNDPIDLNAMAAMGAKLLFSASPNSRNITRDAAVVADRAIAAWLCTCGYRESMNANFPLNVRRRKNNEISVFDALGTHFATGDGWCNMRVEDHVAIQDPLYEGVDEMPQMAGVPPTRTNLDFVDFGLVANPPILAALMASLEELMGDIAKHGSPVHRIFLNFMPMYKQYVGVLNRYLLEYGECGFRLNDRRIRELLAGDDGNGLNDSLNRPLVLSIRYDSVYKFLRAPPESFLPPLSLAEQINAESLISAELQRVMSAFLVMLDRLEVDRRAEGYRNKLVFKWALESTESNHFARKIFELCLNDGEASKLNLNTLRALRPRFDELEAIYFQAYGNIVNENPECFGITMDTLRRRIELPTLAEAEYRRRELTGVILDNTYHRAQGEVIVRLEWEMVETYLRSYRMLTELRNRDRVICLICEYG